MLGCWLRGSLPALSWTCVAATQAHLPGEGGIRYRRIGTENANDLSINYFFKIAIAYTYSPFNVGFNPLQLAITTTCHIQILSKERNENNSKNHPLQLTEILFSVIRHPVSK